MPFREVLVPACMILSDTCLSAKLAYLQFLYVDISCFSMGASKPALYAFSFLLMKYTLRRVLEKTFLSL